MADMVFRPALQRRRLRAGGDPRGDRDVRGRSPGEGVRRARRGGVRRPSARAGDHRPAEVIADTPVARDRSVSPRRATCPERRDRRRRRRRPRALVALARERIAGRARRRRARRARRRRRRRAPERRFERKDTEQYHVCLGGPGSRATTSGASRCACSTRSSAAPPRHACSRRCASGAAWPTRCTRSRAPIRTPARSACTSAPGPRTWPRR